MNVCLSCPSTEVSLNVYMVPRANLSDPETTLLLVFIFLSALTGSIVVHNFILAVTDRSMQKVLEYILSPHRSSKWLDCHGFYYHNSYESKS